MADSILEERIRLPGRLSYLDLHRVEEDRESESGPAPYWTLSLSQSSVEISYRFQNWEVASRIYGFIAGSFIGHQIMEVLDNE